MNNNTKKFYFFPLRFIQFLCGSQEYYRVITIIIGLHNNIQYLAFTVIFT